METEYLTQDDINKLQEYVLKNTTEGNPNLPTGNHPIVPNLIDPNNRYQLDTIKKNVAQAINELLNSTRTSTNAVNKFENRFNTIIGNEDAFESSGGEREILNELREKLGGQTLIKLLQRLNEKTERLTSTICILDNEDDIDKIIDGLIEDDINWGLLKGYELYCIEENQG